MSASSEGGLRDHRIEFVREDMDSNGDPQTPTDPEFETYSDTIRTFDWSPTPGLEARRGISDADPDGHEKGHEEHQLQVIYDLQRWFETAEGEPLDAAYDGLVRTDTNRLPNSHTVLDREVKGTVAEINTVDGTSGARESRVYTVGRGGSIDSVAVTGDPSDQQPVTVELGYEFERYRSFQIDQPAGTTLSVSVTYTDSEGTDRTLDYGESGYDDTTQTLTIEADDGTTEVISLNEDTAVATTAAFDTIDGLELDADTFGTVVVEDDAGTELARIDGAMEYEVVEGDLGVPCVEAGSHAAPIDEPYETIIGDRLEKGGEPFAMDINSRSIEVENNLDRTPREDSFAHRIHVGPRDTTVTATVLGETESHDQIMAALKAEARDIEWYMDGGTLRCPKAVGDEPPSKTVEEGQASMNLDTGFDSQGVVVE